LQLVQLNRALLFLGFVSAMIVARRTPWFSAYRWLAIGTGIGFFLRILTSLAIIRGTYQSGTIYDLAWFVPFLCYAGAALAAPASPAESDVIEAPSPPLHVLVSAVPVFMIPLIGYGALYVQPLGATDDSFRALLTSVMTVAGLGLLTLRLAAQGGELERAGARMRLLAAATEQTGDLILITRADGTFEHANDAFVRALGYSREQLTRLAFVDLLERGFDSIGVHVATAIRERGVWRGTVVRKRRDGTTFPASCTVVGLRDPAGSITHYVDVERDTTEELKLRDQLVHSERLSAIGELVAGVAHEINNPLTGVLTFSTLMRKKMPDGSQDAEDLDLVIRETKRCAGIIRRLLDFAREKAPEKKFSDLNRLVEDTARIIERPANLRDIEMALDLDASLPPVWMDADLIKQVVMNMLVNAQHAVDGKGTITVRTRQAPSKADGPPMVEVAIVDTGCGISPENLARIFDPFFTTKGVGKGTGLGLSVSHGIVEAHGGRIEVESAPGAGTTFRVFLPIEPAVQPAPTEA
jgi:PAS domain S-box-containing protein